MRCDVMSRLPVATQTRRYVDSAPTSALSVNVHVWCDLTVNIDIDNNNIVDPLKGIPGGRVCAPETKRGFCRGRWASGRGAITA